MAERLAPAARHTYAHDGRAIYQWDQTLDEVNVYVGAPPVPANELFCTVQPTRVAFGLLGNPPFLDVRPLPHCIHSTMPQPHTVSIHSLRTPHPGHHLHLHLSVNMGGVGES
jgi:hypothetical protein